ncbi:MAG: hypothetical protein ACK52I_01780 [Pseudomonadota bacterium]|jgi:hypothetical protein
MTSSSLGLFADTARDQAVNRFRAILGGRVVFRAFVLAEDGKVTASGLRNGASFAVVARKDVDEAARDALEQVTGVRR